MSQMAPQRLPATGALGLPAAGLAALPACPACYPAYAAVLGALGLSGLESIRAQTFLTLTFLGVSLAALGFRASVRRGYGPLLLGLAASATVLTGKLWLWLDAVTYAGIAVLVGASLWNVWPRAMDRDAGCGTCAGEGRPVAARPPAGAAWRPNAPGED